jgi:hypothetical protein
MTPQELLVELNKDAHKNSVALVSRARRIVTTRRSLHVISGILALLSGSAITAIATKALSATTWQAVSAAVAFLSGIITLVASTFLADREVQQMFELAGRFLGIREDGSSALQQPNATDTAMYEAYLSLNERYKKAAAEAAPLLPVRRLRRLPARA